MTLDNSRTSIFRAFGSLWFNCEKKQRQERIMDTNFIKKYIEMDIVGELLVILSLSSPSHPHTDVFN